MEKRDPKSSCARIVPVHLVLRVGRAVLCAPNGAPSGHGAHGVRALPCGSWLASPQDGSCLLLQPSDTQNPEPGRGISELMLTASWRPLRGEPAAWLEAGAGRVTYWNNPPALPSDEEPFRRVRLAWTFLLTSPGVPLLYYGDEVGMEGAGDPDNRKPMRFAWFAVPVVIQLIFISLFCSAISVKSYPSSTMAMNSTDLSVSGSV